MPRLPIEMKKRYLRAFEARPEGETQKQFCARNGLHAPTFCKWLAKADEICRTPDSRCNREVESYRTAAKRVLRHHVQCVHDMGVSIDVSMVKRIADRCCPLVFRGVRGYNARYVLCKRLLEEMRLGSLSKADVEVASPRQQQAEADEEMEMAGTDSESNGGDDNAQDEETERISKDCNMSKCCDYESARTSVPRLIRSGSGLVGNGLTVLSSVVV